MMNLVLVYPLLIAALVAIAIYVQVSSSTLSLPLSTATTVLTMLLPIIAAANAFFMPVLRKRFLRTRSSALQQLLVPALQIIQAILTVVLATLTFEGFIPGQNLNCNLEGNWQRLWHLHDGRAIERIQDAFNCCGLNSVVDRAWPPGQCEYMYRRHGSCAGPWRASMQRSSGLGFAVALAVGILQLAHLALLRLRNSSNGGAATYRRLAQSVGAVPGGGRLEDGQADDSDDEAGRNNGTGGTGRGYGAIDNGSGHRIEPSGLGEERNQW
ncbi:hypothetical protein F4779DRAFT_599166 [Xylariaceae sp. FL0662B]|nr:hypothetical protein F4779DRAFT_599166 [Xylariaceae sp. FL0662B]